MMGLEIEVADDGGGGWWRCRFQMMGGSGDIGCR